MPAGEATKQLLSDAQKIGTSEAYKIDDYGIPAAEKAGLRFTAKSFGPDAQFDPDTLDITGAWTDSSMVTRLLTEPFQSSVPFRFGEEQLIRDFTIDKPVLSWVTNALNAWTLYQAGLDASIGSYIERVKLRTKKVSRPVPLDLPTIYRMMRREKLSLDNLTAWPSSLLEQLGFQGLEPDIEPYAFKAFDTWPDLGNIIGWQFRNSELFRASTDLPPDFKQPPGWSESTYEGFRDRLVHAQGLPAWSWELYEQASQRPIDLASAKAIFLRLRSSNENPPDVSPGTITPTPEGIAKGWSDWFDRVLYRNRLRTADITALRELDWMIPPVQDLITMGVREVFTPEIAERFGQFQDIPPDFTAWSAKAGLSEFWSKNYWAAHWQLPSPQMGFDMLHRGFIQMDDMEKLLRAQDVMPFWREKIINIAYRIYTRVDTRRMHKIGVMTEEDVKKSYLDQGYPDDKATKMKDFTLAFNAESERDLTKGEVIKGYKLEQLTYGEANKALKDLNYSDSAIAFLLKMALYQKEDEERELSTSQIKQLYVFGTIDDGKAEDMLNVLLWPAATIKMIMGHWKIAKAQKQQGEDEKPKKLTLVQLKRFLFRGIITTEQWQAEMDNHGYTAEQIDWISIDMMMDIEEE